MTWTLSELTQCAFFGPQNKGSDQNHQTAAWRRFFGQRGSYRGSQRRRQHALGHWEVQMRSAALLLGLTLIASPASAQNNAYGLNTDGIAVALGRKGDLTGEMYKVSFPRSDLSVKVGTLTIKPALSLVAWAAFVKSGVTAVTYGDLVVLEDEVNPVISKLEEKGLELSALHNHLLHETPRVVFIHFVGSGDEVE